MDFDFLKPWKDKEKEDLQKSEKENVRSFSAPDNFDGATQISTQQLTPEMSHAQAVNTAVAGTQPGSRPDTKALIGSYRALARHHEVDDAIQEIVDQAIVQEDDKEVLWLNLDNTEFTSGIQTSIQKQFDHIVRLLEMRSKGPRWFRKWYIDSRLYFHKILDTKGNIQELRPLNPLHLELIREVEKKTINGVEVVTNTLEYYKYSKKGSSNETYYSGGSTDVRIPKDAIVYAPSGITDGCAENQYVIGYLQRAIKPANQLKQLEDALVIYRLARAPERRVFYVDVGNLPTQKAQQYVNNIMNSVKNRVVYDPSTGSVKNAANATSMLEDYYLPRREGSKGTEISTLPGGSNLGDIEDVLYFNRKLFKAMRIPTSRASGEDSQGGISFGGGGEITRDELKFTKFVRRLQHHFNDIIIDPLKHQLINNKIITEEEWELNKEKIYVVFNKDSYFEESKDLEILNSRVQALRDLDDYTGKYYSHSYIMKNVLHFSDDQIDQMAEEIQEEENDPRFKQEDDGF